MRSDITRQPLGIVLVQIMLLMLLFWCRAEFVPTVAERVDMSSGFALGGILDGLVQRLGALGQLIIVGVVFTSAMLVTRIVTRNMVLEVRTFVPALFYIMVSCGLYVGWGVSGYLVSMLTINGSYYFIRAFRRAASFDFVFRAGLMFGLAVLMSFEALLLIVPAIMAVILFRRSSREALVTLVGFLLPLALCSYVYWGMGHDFSYVVQWGWQSLGIFRMYGIYIGAIGVPQIVFVSVLTLVIFLALGSFVVNVRNMRNRAYRIFIYFIWLLLFGVVMFVIPSRSAVGYSLVAVGVAVIAPYYFVKHRNRTANIIYATLLASVIAANVIPFFV